MLFNMTASGGGSSVSTHSVSFDPACENEPIVFFSNGGSLATTEDTGSSPSFPAGTVVALYAYNNFELTGATIGDIIDVEQIDVSSAVFVMPDEDVVILSWD